MFELITSLVSTGGLSGILGLAAGLFQRAQDLKLKAMEFKDKGADRDSRYKELELESNTALKTASIQAEAQVESEMQTQAGEDFRAAIEADKRTYSTGKMPWYHPLVLVDAMRGSVRIFVTFYMLFMMTYIAETISVVSNVQKFTPDQQYGLTMQIVQSVIALTFMVVGFWFGQRGKSSKAK